MDLAHFGKGSYSGGVPDSEWNTWKWWCYPLQ
jgi:hypothetical protein